MTVMRRSPFGILILVGLGVLLGATLSGGSAATAGWLAAPFLVFGLIFKILFFFLLFGFIAKAFGGHRRWEKATGPWSEEARQHWQKRHEATAGDEPRSSTDRFEEWHRMAHAREEVDDHVPPVED
ncbi:MAG: hypothetical protein JJE47_02760 [Acidimicrobiia bacterium]|nr:hypothetical protein [Acidimicrobiia bacterium]